MKCIVSLCIVSLYPVSGIIPNNHNLTPRSASIGYVVCIGVKNNRMSKSNQLRKFAEDDAKALCPAIEHFTKINRPKFTVKQVILTGQNGTIDSLTNVLKSLPDNKPFELYITFSGQTLLLNNQSHLVLHDSEMNGKNTLCTGVLMNMLIHKKVSRLVLILDTNYSSVFFRPLGKLVSTDICAIGASQMGRQSHEYNRHGLLTQSVLQSIPGKGVEGVVGFTNLFYWARFRVQELQDEAKIPEYQIPTLFFAERAMP